MAGVLSEAEVAGGSMDFCSIRGGELSGGGPKYSTAGLKEVLLFFAVVMELRRSSGASRVLMLIGDGSGWIRVGGGVVDTRVSGRYRSGIPVGGEVVVLRFLRAID
jgi:hypothetical protein